MAAATAPRRIPRPSFGTSKHALISIFGVIGGTYLMFMALSPNKDGSLISDKEREAMRGGSNGTPFGTKSARPPRSTAH